LYQAENANAMQTKEAVAMQVVNYYTRLRTKTVEPCKKIKRVPNNVLSILPH
jgi:hypothetical protein